jgi:hypothetical protein
MLAEQGDVYRSFLFSNGPALIAFGALAVILLFVGLLRKKSAIE